MADCSKTEVFLAEWERFCRSRRYICSECPMSICCRHVYDMKNKGLAIIQKWSDEHPAPKPKTYADDFFEKFPKASKCYFNEKDYVNGNGFPEVKRCSVYGVGIHGCKEWSCTREAQMKCWNEPYKEDAET